jgi:hypothetical protein
MQPSVLFVRRYTLKRAVVREGQQVDDLETGITGKQAPVTIAGGSDDEVKSIEKQGSAEKENSELRDGGRDDATEKTQMSSM